MATAVINMIRAIEYNVTIGEKKLLTKNGDRKPVNFINKINFAEGYYVDKAVLTLLDNESKLYSLSIKVDKSKVFNLNSLNFYDKRLYSSKTKTYKDLNKNQNQKNNLSHVLFIGKVEQTDDKFIIKKTILIIIDEGIGEAIQHNDIGGQEEYLNLHHIDYFSFMYDDFLKMYDEYKVKNESENNPNSRTTLSELNPLPKPANGKTQQKKSQPGAKAAEEEAQRKKEEEARKKEEEPREEDKDKEEDEATAATRATAARAGEEAAQQTTAATRAAARAGEEAARKEAAVDNADGMETDKPVPQLLATRAAGYQDAAAPVAAQVVEPVVEPGAQTQADGDGERKSQGGGKKKVKKTKTKKSQKSLNN